MDQKLGDGVSSPDQVKMWQLNLVAKIRWARGLEPLMLNLRWRVELTLFMFIRIALGPSSECSSNKRGGELR